MESHPFDIEEVAKILSSSSHTKYGLQFSRAYSSCAISLLSEIKQLPGAKGKSLYLLADQSLGQCCVDFLSARSLSVECILYFGDSCFANYTSPVHYIWPRKKVDVEDLVNCTIAKCDPNKTNIVLCECGLMYCYKEVKEKVAAKVTKVVFSEDGAGSKLIMGRPVNIPGEVRNTNIIYLGADDEMFEPLIWTYGANNTICRIENGVTDDCTKRVNVTLMQRHAAIENAKKAKIFGIILGNPYIKEVASARKVVRTTLRKHQRKCFEFYFGKLTEEKLANFDSIDMYVYIGCPVSTCIKHREFYKPVITPPELLLALDGVGGENWFDTETVYLSEFVAQNPESVKEEEKKEMALESVQTALMPATWLTKRQKERQEDVEEEVGYDIEEGMSGIPGEYSYEKSHK